MKPETASYNNNQIGEEKAICYRLATLLDEQLPAAENKIWHKHPVWFLDGNPIVGYSKSRDSTDVLERSKFSRSSS